MDYSTTGRNRQLSSSWTNMVFDFQENAHALNNSFFLFYVESAHRSSLANMVFDFQENAHALNNSFSCFMVRSAYCDAHLIQCVCLDNIDWDRRVEKQPDKTPSTIDLLNTTQCQALGIDGVKIHQGNYFPLSPSLFSFYVAAKVLMFNLQVSFVNYKDLKYMLLEWIGMNTMMVYFMAAEGIFVGFINGWYYDDPHNTLLRLSGSNGDMGSYGHEYVSIMLKPEAVDLLMESYHMYLPGSDDILLLDTACMIYIKFEEYPNALQITLFLDKMQGIEFELDDDMVVEDEDRYALQDIINNSKLS
ncbi:hypothetical protein Ddye_003878 [Dipteronia dyeriana]|uniref:RPN1 N-terminal domain-containing protein n=1 Tax=Dipteronia dyeriana TaxID=168575 RepID=A0AAE0CVV9_9ROSI|nr:hypothetical protein Ddye_003878 [Dipteronia dyeriana]